MIIKHSQYIPDIYGYLPDKNHYLYLDIETTGLSAKTTILYMIGCGFAENKAFHVIQWFNDDGACERDLLLAFSAFLKEQSFSSLVTFNGEGFDLPYLRYRYRILDIPLPAPLEAGELAAAGSSDEKTNAPDAHKAQLLTELTDAAGTPSIDLFRTLRPFRYSLGLSRVRQKDWEELLSISREDQMSGKDCIRLYRAWLKGRLEGGNAEPEKLIFLHNYEDVCHLFLLTPLLVLKNLADGNVSISDHNESNESSHIQIYKLRSEGRHTYFPGHFLLDSPRGSLELSGNRVRLSLPTIMTEMKYYFSDYRNYYYLPGEDRAVHKSIGQYVDRQHRTKCTPQNCYVRKKGVFLPLYSGRRKKKPGELRNQFNQDLTLYRHSYDSQNLYLDLDELSAKDEKTLIPCLIQNIKVLLIPEEKEVCENNKIIINCKKVLDI